MCPCRIYWLLRSFLSASSTFDVRSNPASESPPPGMDAHVFHSLKNGCIFKKLCLFLETFPLTISPPPKFRKEIPSRVFSDQNPWFFRFNTPRVSKYWNGHYCFANPQWQALHWGRMEDFGQMIFQKISPLDSIFWLWWWLLFLLYKWFSTLDWGSMRSNLIFEIWDYRWFAFTSFAFLCRKNKYVEEKK